MTHNFCRLSVTLSAIRLFGLRLYNPCHVRPIDRISDSIHDDLTQVLTVGLGRLYVGRGILSRTFRVRCVISIFASYRGVRWELTCAQSAHWKLTTSLKYHKHSKLLTPLCQMQHFELWHFKYFKNGTNGILRSSEAGQLSSLCSVYVDLTSS